MEPEGCRPGTSGAFRIAGMMPGLQPSNRFDVPIPGAVPQAGIVRTVGAGEGENGESTPLDANGAGRCGWGLTDFPRQRMAYFHRANGAFYVSPGQRPGK